MKDVNSRKVADRVAGALDRLKNTIHVVADAEFDYIVNIALLEEFIEDLEDITSDAKQLLDQQIEWKREDEEKERLS